MTKKITPTNINRWNMTENVQQRLTIMGEMTELKTFFFGHIHQFSFVILMNLFHFYFFGHIHRIFAQVQRLIFVGAIFGFYRSRSSV